VRALERLFPHRAPVGGFASPADEVVHFTAHPSISFPTSEIQRLELPPGETPRMVVNFMGLTGPMGLLPHFYTLHVVEATRAKDFALRDFLDMFHHRFISLHYRAWAKYRFGEAQEPWAPEDTDDRPPPPQPAQPSDRLTQCLLALVGLGAPEVRHRLPMPDEALLFYAGLLAPEPRSAIALERLIGDYFDVPATVEQFVGGWYPLETSIQCSVGESADAAGELGVGTVAGDEVWDPQARVRIRLGPLSRRQYEQFLPNGSAYEPLRTLTRFFGGDQLDFDLQLVLARHDVPGCVLGEDEEPVPPLGWCTWLRTAPLARDPDDTTFTLSDGSLYR
jgi:type VI secretion system protein ImpH